MSLTPWDRVKIARSKDRPTAMYYIENVFDQFIELHGDRHFGDDGAIIGGSGIYRRPAGHCYRAAKRPIYKRKYREKLWNAQS